MYLYLDTTERDSFQVALVDKGQALKHKTILSVRQHSEKLLKTVNVLLQHHPYPSSLQSGGQAKRRGLQGIAVVKGPGSFTSLRVGISTANALAFGLGIPVLGVKPGGDLKKLDLFFKNKKPNIVLPEYGQPPHITLGR